MDWKMKLWNENCKKSRGLEKSKVVFLLFENYDIQMKDELNRVLSISLDAPS